MALRLGVRTMPRARSTGRRLIKTKGTRRALRENRCPHCGEKLTSNAYERGMAAIKRLRMRNT